MPWAVLVCKNMPSPTWLNGSIADDISVDTLAINVGDVGVGAIVMLELLIFSMGCPDISSLFR